VPGWYGMTVKWLDSIEDISTPFNGYLMQAYMFTIPWYRLAARHDTAPFMLDLTGRHWICRQPTGQADQAPQGAIAHGASRRA